MRNFLVSVIVLGLAVLAFVPTTAATHIPTTGTRLTMYLALPHCSSKNPDIRAVPIEWPANSAFFTRHGWVVNDISALTPEERSAFLGPNTTFELYVDGVELQSILDLDQGETSTTKLFVNNFPDGLTGTHELRGWWFIDGLLVGGTKGEEVFAEACALRVSFI